ncbi:MAG: NAD(P)-binding domain-containing protein [Acidobacteriota bacterium]|nr:NAD(P)-binding domain-containing protein [Acidobacteriota bacterium]
MNIGVLGTGTVGPAIAGKLVSLGHHVRMGAREAGNEKARQWADSAGPGASHGTFADAASFGEIVFNATAGAASIEALQAAGRANLRGKVLVDVANPLDFSRGMPPSVFTAAAGDSLAERIQKELPDTRVVKALNTINASVMVDPGRVGGETDVFVCGNDAGAKERVTGLLRDFGWKSIRDVGDLTAARALESYVLLWLTLFLTFKTPEFNIRIVGA